MGDLGVEEDRPFVPSFAVPLCNPDPISIRAENWVLASDPVREVLNCIHPTLDSDEKRKDVIEYVQKLIRCSLGLEVFPYGSVPLKTYLPDGDIDLTVLSTPNLDEPLPREVLRVFQEVEQNGNTEFELKDTQFIDAEVDRLVGKDHLFKRSIILIKAWCYYESRILGAHHGLISTYALETLVLYIFHVFHASLNGPIQVLYRFLDYYSKFDWDNYCISLDGPVCKSSLPNFTAQNPENEGSDVLLSAEFRKNCMDMFIVPSKGLDADLRAFALKHLNIVDPLKDNNNLGRSVHRGNYYRIRSAFRFGARKLGRILQLPNTNIGDEIKKFFTNTLQRHKPKYSHEMYASKGFGTLSISSFSEPFYEDDMYSRFSNGDFDDDISIVGLKCDQNAPPPYNESNLEKTGLEMWMERGASQFVDGDTFCVCINNSKNDNGNLSDEDGSDSIGETEMLNPFSDLTGDYDGHIRNLLYGQGCHGYALSTAVVRTSPPTSPYGWDPAAISWSNGAQMVYPNGTNRIPVNTAVRGTGPYIPVVNCTTCKERPATTTRGRGRNRGGPAPSNGHMQREPKLVVEPNHGSLERSPRRGFGNSDLYNQTQQQLSQVNLTAVNQPRKLEFGSFASLPDDPSPTYVHSPKPNAFGKKQGRIGENSLHLKNEDEFPPLNCAYKEEEQS